MCFCCAISRVCIPHSSDDASKIQILGCVSFECICSRPRSFIRHAHFRLLYYTLFSTVSNPRSGPPVTQAKSGPSKNTVTTIEGNASTRQHTLEKRKYALTAKKVLYSIILYYLCETEFPNLSVELVDLISFFCLFVFCWYGEYWQRQDVPINRRSSSVQ